MEVAVYDDGEQGDGGDGEEEADFAEAGEEGGAVPRDDERDGGGEPEQEEVKTWSLAVTIEAQGKDGNDPCGEGEVPFAADSDEVEGEGEEEEEVVGHGRFLLIYDFGLTIYD